MLKSNTPDCKDGENAVVVLKLAFDRDEGASASSDLERARIPIPVFSLQSDLIGKADWISFFMRRFRLSISSINVEKAAAELMTRSCSGVPNALKDSG